MTNNEDKNQYLRSDTDMPNPDVVMDDDLKVKVIGFGALNLDKLFYVDEIVGPDEETFIKSETSSPGGSAANTMIALSKLGLPTSYIGKIATDDDGDMLEMNLAKSGVFLNHLIYAEEGHSGKVLGFVDKNGVRSLYVDPGVNDDIVISELNHYFINQTKILHYTSFVGESFHAQNELLDKLNDSVILSFDPGMLYVKKGVNGLRKILQRTNILLINKNELMLLFKDYFCEKFNLKEEDNLTFRDISVHLLDEGIDTVVVKNGSKGVYAINSLQEVKIPAYEVDVVDTTAAGDCFNAGFLYGYLNKYSLENSCKLGNWVASLSISGKGLNNLPNKKDLEEFETLLK